MFYDRCDSIFERNEIIVAINLKSGTNTFYFTYFSFFYKVRIGYIFSDCLLACLLVDWNDLFVFLISKVLSRHIVVHTCIHHRRNITIPVTSSQ